MQQSILKKNPDQAIRVYAVWQPAYDRDTYDAAVQAANDLFKDKRVRHIWDGDNALGAWYTENGPLKSTARYIWDACYLYAADARWHDRLIDAAHPVLDGIDRLTSHLPSVER